MLTNSIQSFRNDRNPLEWLEIDTKLNSISAEKWNEQSNIQEFKRKIKKKRFEIEFQSYENDKNPIKSLKIDSKSHQFGTRKWKNSSQSNEIFRIQHRKIGNM